MKQLGIFEHWLQHSRVVHSLDSQREEPLIFYRHTLRFASLRHTHTCAQSTITYIGIKPRAWFDQQKCESFFAAISSFHKLFCRSWVQQINSVQLCREELQQNLLKHLTFSARWLWDYRYFCLHFVGSHFGALNCKMIKMRTVCWLHCLFRGYCAKTVGCILMYGCCLCGRGAFLGCGLMNACWLCVQGVPAGCSCSLLILCWLCVWGVPMGGVCVSGAHKGSFCWLRAVCLFLGLW